MLFPQIDKIKDEYTDKYVVVDGKRPELARFSDLVGQVKTVNMSGRALVEFMDYHLNIGWFDIDLDYLKVVDKPAPKEKKAKKPVAKKAAPKKPAAGSGEKKLSPLEMARMQGAGAKPAAKKKSSTADILAAARGGASAKSEPKAEAPAKPSSGAVDRSKMSVADMLAAARAGKPAAAPATESKPEPAAEPEPAPEAAAEASTGKVDKTSMSIDEMIAYCREKDAE